MKKHIATAITMAVLGTANASDSDDLTAMAQAIAVLQGRQPQEVQSTPYNPQLQDILIRSAYPNSPELWRYLERNPRYVDYYLGR